LFSYLLTESGRETSEDFWSSSFLSLSISADTSLSRYLCIYVYLASCQGTCHVIYVSCDIPGFLSPDLSCDLCVMWSTWLPVRWPVTWSMCHVIYLASCQVNCHVIYVLFLAGEIEAPFSIYNVSRQASSTVNSFSICFIICLFLFGFVYFIIGNKQGRLIDLWDMYTCRFVRYLFVYICRIDTYRY